VTKKVQTHVEIKVDGDETGPVKVDEVVEQKDDIGVKIEADLQDEGKVEVQTLRGVEDDVKHDLAAY
jgi:hypothetical protein